MGVLTGRDDIPGPWEYTKLEEIGTGTSGGDIIVVPDELLSPILVGGATFVETTEDNSDTLCRLEEKIGWMTELVDKMGGIEPFEVPPED